MLNRSRFSGLGVVPVLASLCLTGLVVGCSDDEFSDEYYGAIDLAPYFFDGATPERPTLGLPTNIRPQRGWMNGQRAEYYDFGLVNHVRKRSTTGSTLSVPDYSLVSPIYFFFDSKGSPMFSPPTKDHRTQLWSMRGGKDVTQANPLVPTGVGAKQDRSVPYSVRIRNRLIDPKRNTADYQRPIIDITNANSEYSGLWEIWEVKDLTGSYEPDAIKTRATLFGAVDAGKFSVRRTQKVIDCPLVDDRTYVHPSPMRYTAYERMPPNLGPLTPGPGDEVPRPRMEIWYRTKVGSCYMIHGWEALGDDQFIPYAYGSDKRLNTFDVISFTIGDGAAAQTTVVAPTGKMWWPTVNVANQNPMSPVGQFLRYHNDFLTDSLPRHRESDPPGYRPVRWLQDLTVDQSPPYENGTYRDIKRVDPAQLAARAGGPWTRSFSIIGTAIPCGGWFDQEKCGPNLACNPDPDPDLALADAPAGRTLPQMTALREGGPRCDVPFAEFGEYCALGVAQCLSQVPLGTPQFDALTALLGAAVAGPSLLLASDGSPATPAKAAVAATATASAMPAMPSNADPNKSYSGIGYACNRRTGLILAGAAPTAPTPVAPPGYCQIRCDSGASNSLSGSNAVYIVPKLTYLLRGGKTKDAIDVRFNLDSRCGGAKMVGYTCQSPDGATTPTKQRVCMRSCSGADTDTLTTQMCEFPLSPPAMPKDYVPGMETPMVKLGSRVEAAKFTGQVCQQSTCTWDPAHEPRDTKLWPY